MENSEDNEVTSKSFNNQLFTLNGAPLKFYIQGYGPTQFQEIVEIIQNYGGELSSPDAPDTFVFCKSDYRVDLEKYDRYDIQYFKDSFRALQPQDLMKYKLQRCQNEESLRFDDEVRSPRSEAEEENIGRPPKLVKYKLQDSPDRPSTSSEDENDELTESRYDEQENNSEDDDCVDSTSSDAEELIECRNERNPCSIREAKVYVERLDERQIAGLTTNLQTNDRDNRDYDGDSEIGGQGSTENGDFPKSTVSKTTDDSPPSQSESDNGEIPADYHRPTKKVKEKKGKRGRQTPTFTENENETIIKWLMENNFMPSRTGFSIWNRLVKEKVLPRRDITQFNLQGLFSRELSKHPIFLKWIKDMKTSGRQSTAVLGRSRKTPFTAEEDIIIIRWLMEKDVIPSKRGESIWKKFLKEKILPKRDDLSAVILAGHFKRELKDHPTILKWIEDARTSGHEIKSADARVPQYSEEENRAMMNHIINHDAYHRAMGKNVWQELLDANKSSMNPGRTAEGLHRYFRDVLLKKIAEYTDDPEVLRKFKEIELRRQFNTQDSEERIDLN